MNLQPSARRRASLAASYPPAGSALVLFGGLLTNNSYSDETWVHHASLGWRLKDLLVAPDARTNHAAVSISNTLSLLFGGVGTDGSLLGDTWLWDGATEAWEQQLPQTAPTARHSFAIAYDPSRAKVVLHGGVGAGAVVLEDTWELDTTGLTWAEIAPETSHPGPRKGHKMAWDPARSRVILLGGYDGGGYPQEMWEWDGNDWSERLVTLPLPCEEFVLVTNTDTSMLLAFGGHRPASDGAIFQDTWEYGGEGWVKKTELRKAPETIHGSCSLYDLQNKIIVTFGGVSRTEETLARPFTWNGSAWIAGVAPTPRFGAPMVYDSARNKHIIFSGKRQITEANLSGTWELDKNGWVNQNPGTEPPSRYGHAMAYDVSRGVTVMFGGHNQLTDLWEWDGETWVEKVGHLEAGDSPREGFSMFGSMVYDSGRELVVYLGGLAGNGYASILARGWNGQTWVDLVTSGSPTGGTIDYSAGYDPVRAEIVLFGGATGVGVLAETWVLTTSGAWQNRTPVTNPTARKGARMVWHETRETLVLFGGADTDGTLLGSNFWEWDGSNWTELLSEGPLPRSLAGMSYDPNYSQVVLTGGVGNGLLNDLWIWNSNSWVQGTPGVVPTITTTTLPEAVLGVDYSKQIVATGTTPLDFSKVGELPAGIALNRAGLLLGQPTTAGVFEFSAVAENPPGITERAFTFAVTQPPPEEAQEEVLDVVSVNPYLTFRNVITQIVVKGHKFSGATQVALGEISLVFAIQNNTTILATIPAGVLPGVYPIKVTTPVGISRNLDPILVVANPLPWIPGLSPIAFNRPLVESPDGVRQEFHTTEHFVAGSCAIFKNWLKQFLTDDLDNPDGYQEVGTDLVKFNLAPLAGDMFFSVSLLVEANFVLNDQQVLGDDLVYEASQEFNTQFVLVFLNTVWASPLTVPIQILNNRRIKFLGVAVPGDVVDAMYIKL